jgi:hypothetical protein
MITVRRAIASDSHSLIELAAAWPIENGSWVVPHENNGSIDKDGPIQKLNEPAFCIVVVGDRGTLLKVLKNDKLGICQGKQE